MIHRASIVISLTCLLVHYAFTQTLAYSASGDSITLAANPNLQAGWFHRFLFGSLWRDVWTTPVQVRILYSNELLRKEYSFTPLEQDSVISLPPELAELLPKNIITDQISILNPYIPLFVAPILQAVNLPYREVRLTAINKYNSDLVSSSENMVIGFLEGQWHNIDSNQLDSPTPKFINTSAMLDSLDENNFTSLDELQYLKARFIDIFFGDWDRSPDQWQWFSTHRNGQVIWKPVPLNHRQAFVRINGILPTIADIVLPQFEHCGENYSSIDNLTLTGRTLDRRLLISFTKQTWDSLALWIQFQISDSVLTDALQQLPVSILEKEEAALVRLLQSRRTQLPKAAEEFYKLMSQNVEVHGSNKAERVEVRRIGKHVVSITLYDCRDTLHIPIYQRLFHDENTEEVRILLLGGDDIVSLDGDGSSTIKIIIDGGEGNNKLIDNTKSGNFFTSLNPLSSLGTIFYTSDPDFHTAAHSNIQIIHDQARDGTIDQRKTLHLLYRDWGSEWSFSPWFDINPDDGLFIGGGPVYTQYEYRMDPYAQQMSVRAGLATRTNRYRFDAAGEFRDWFRGIRTVLQFHASQLDISNFFGSGNETRYNQSLNDAGFYFVDQRQIYFHASFDFSLTSNIAATGSGTLKLIDNNPKQGTLLDTLKLPFYNRSLTFLKLGTQVQSDTRDSKKLPTQGMYSIAEISYFPKFLDNEHSFYKLRGELRGYFTLKNIPSITIAVRATGEKIWGEHPFFESAFLGGNESLRGFERQRFSGDASILGGAEVRTQIARIPFIIPLWSGISVFAETGRVFLAGEHSKHWHNTFGGGAWFWIMKLDYIANFSLARSEDKIAFYATMGFMF